jgi:glutamate synthase (NADPH) small chain
MSQESRMADMDGFSRMGPGLDLEGAMREADRCLLCHDAPCSKGCPADTDPGSFIRKLRFKNVTGAIRTIKENNALGGACGVLCPTARLCEKECSATGIDAPIRIGAIQRALVEHSWRLGLRVLAKPEPRPERAAVVGSGPAGLACAAELAKAGLKVTVFEERSEPGGIIRYGVPAYRFDKDFLQHELEDLRFLGVEFKCGNRVDGAKGVRKLMDEGFKAVFVAPGLWKAVAIPGGEGLPGVYGSVDFLAACRGDKVKDLAGKLEGKDVAVVGGGSVAIDCAESAKRLGARDVYLVYRRSFAQMPAEEDESLEAMREGIHFLVLNQPVGFEKDAKGGLAGLKLRRCRLGSPDASGRRAPEELSGTEWTLPVQAVVEAIGNVPDGADWSGAAEVKKGLIAVDAESAATRTKGVYAGGDIARGPALVVEAVKDGKAAAKSIIESLGKGGAR